MCSLFNFYFLGQDKGRPLPKFGEWDVNNPATSEGFTVIFNKARDEKKTNNGAAVNLKTPRKPDPEFNNESYAKHKKVNTWKVESPSNV